MPNRWVQFVKDWASANNTTYGCALSKPEVSQEYKRKYPKPLTKKQLAKPVVLQESEPPANVKSLMTGPKVVETLAIRPKKKMTSAAKERFRMAGEDILSKEMNAPVRENIQMSMEDVNYAVPKPKKKSRGRPIKWQTEEEKYKAKLESNKLRRQEKRRGEL
jgi:hypothetical protein